MSKALELLKAQRAKLAELKKGTTRESPFDILLDDKAIVTIKITKIEEKAAGERDGKVKKEQNFIRVSGEVVSKHWKGAIMGLKFCFNEKACKEEKHFQNFVETYAAADAVLTGGKLVSTLDELPLMRDLGKHWTGKLMNVRARQWSMEDNDGNTVKGNWIDGWYPADLKKATEPKKPKDEEAEEEEELPNQVAPEDEELPPFDEETGEIDEEDEDAAF